jgi:allophanate hydrolase
MVGKTNLDQFAAGLVGTRTPYGTARNPFDYRFLPGGSSSGSGAVIGMSLLSFALGTDTAGSGVCTRSCQTCKAHLLSLALTCST